LISKKKLGLTNGFGIGILKMFRMLELISKYQNEMLDSGLECQNETLKFSILILQLFGHA